MSLSIHTVYAAIFKIWRRKRMDLFIRRIQPALDEVLLDVGGYPTDWIARPRLARRIDCLNPHLPPWPEEMAARNHVGVVLGDGCALPFENEAYDVLYSNSVIEHVGDWEDQRAFAAEARRVGQRLWIQTPALECPVEPHYLAPFVHWLPVPLRRFMVKWLTPWGWMVRPGRQLLDDMMKTRLLSKSEMRLLFPDCEILTERLLWLLPKSYIACRPRRRS